jgi:hypothetical protein
MSEEKITELKLKPVTVNCGGWGCFLVLLGVAAIIVACRFTFHG